LFDNRDYAAAQRFFVCTKCGTSSHGPCEKRRAMTSPADRITAGNPGSVTTATGIVIRPDPTAEKAVDDALSQASGAFAYFPYNYTHPANQPDEEGKP
jgi:hypothetical protein